MSMLTARCAHHPRLWLRLTALALFLLGVPVLGQAPRFFPRTLTFEGRLTHVDHERLFEQPFEVPPGTRRIEVVVTNTGRDRRTVLDVGLRGPSGFRGWSGGRVETIRVSSLTATPGYLPGPIEPGSWAVLIGVPNIRQGSEDAYAIRITLHDDDLPAPTLVVRPGPGWYAGDLHAHSGHSDGRIRMSSTAPIGGPPHVVFDAARAAGLDFVTLSDHNTAAHWLDVDRLQPYYDSMLLLHGREVTTYRGHANTAGERSFSEFRLPTPHASPAERLRAIAATGAFVSINHPGRPDDESCMGCGWNVTDDEMLRAVHGVEVVNGMTRSGPQWGWPIWAAWLNRGVRLTAVGGSDEHTPDETRDYRIGEPTTVVWARELSEPAIVDGLKSGRVYIRTRGPQGPTLEFDAEVDGTSYPMGAVIPATGPTRIRLSARVGRAEGQTLWWVRNGAVTGVQPVGAGPAEHEVDAAPGDWFSVTVTDGPDVTLIGNPVYLRR
jgi:predicted metal-dependent phosphoesterase TrpH